MSEQELIEYIDHKGSVSSIDKAAGTITVVLADTAECEGCAAAKLCNSGKGSSSEQTVAVSHPEKFRIGQHVTLRGTERLHRKAIMIATVIPSVALVAVMVLIFLFTANQTAAALGGIGAMVFFFVMLWLFRNKIAHEFAFDVIPED